MRFGNLITTGFIILVLLAFGCSKSPTPTCDKPYIKVGAQCCLDQNYNKVCDKDESAIAATPPNETPKATAPAAVVCNKPYLLVGTACCLDKNGNSICDSDEAQPENKTPKINPTKLLNSIVTIKVHSPIPLEDPGKYTDEEYNASGFIASEDGKILTNAHVVEDYIFYCFLQSEYVNRAYSCKLTATNLEGNTYDLDWLGFDSEWDVAVLRIKGQSRKFTPLELSRDSGKIGDSIFVLGAPEGLEFSVTRGIISQKNRGSIRMPEDKAYSKYIQTDAAVNPGNSGGPMVNEEGKVVGMATYGYLISEGLNFGLQSEEITSVYERTYNETTTVFQKTEDLTAQKAESYSKAVTIEDPSQVNFNVYTEREEVAFDSLNLDVNNNMNTSINLCFNARLVTWSGIIKYNQKIPAEIEAKPKARTHVELKPAVTVKGDTTHFYIVDIYDCKINKVYGRLLGPSTYLK